MRVIRMFQAGRRLCSTAAAGTTTVKETVSRLASQFESASVPEPMLSASHLVAHVIKTNNLDDLEQMADDDVEPEQSLKLDAMAKCRLSRMPVQYIVGSWDFRRLTLAMKPPVFIPRPETEQLVSLVLESLKSSEKQRVLEIGSGSGAIALSLLKECGDAEALEVTAVDQSRLACALTMENAILNDVWKGLRVLNARMEEDGVMRMRKKSEKGREDFAKFDLIVSNPPYVLRKDLAALATEIAVYEDLRALDGGADGLRIIMPILKFASKHLSDGGRVFLEVDPCHPLLMDREIQKHPDDITLEIAETHRDFAGKERFMVFRRRKC